MFDSDEESKIYNIATGIQQGCILGSLLWIIVYESVLLSDSEVDVGMVITFRHTDDYLDDKVLT